eukprot:Ihof_evm2s233 gene=Ihof_evmTU2s233
MSSVKSELKAAREALKEKDYKGTLKHCKAVITLDKKNYNAYVFVGAAAEGLENPSQAEQAYRKAIDIEPNQPLAFQGLARLYEKGGDADQSKLVEVYQSLAEVMKNDHDKWISFMGKAATVSSTLGQHTKAADIWLVTADKLAQLPDARVDEIETILKAANSLEKAESLAASDVSTMISTLSDTKLDDIYNRLQNLAKQCESIEDSKVKYMQLGQDTIGKRVARLRRYYWLTKNKKAFQSAREVASDWAAQPEITKGLEQLCELADEDAYDGTQYDLHSLYQLVAQKAPNHPLALVGKGVEAKDISILEQGVQQYPQHTAGWIELIGLLVGPNPTRGESLVAKALQYFGGMKERGGTLLRSLQKLRLLLAKCHISLGTSNYSLGFTIYEDILAEDPACVAAMQGMSEIRVLQGDYSDARARLGQALALIGPESSLQLEMACDMGWICYLMANYSSAEETFIKAIREAPTSGSETTLAICHYRLGRLYWDMDGVYREDKTKAQFHLLTAGKLNPQLAGPFAYLGNYFAIVANNTERAIKCYTRAVSIDPKDTDAAVALSDLLLAKRDYAGAQLVHTQVCDVLGPRAPWAWFRSGLYYLKAGDGNAAVMAFQTMLRGNSQSPLGWECLGEAYSKLGKYSASLKAFGRAMELHSSQGSDTLHCRYSTGRAQHLLGLKDDAINTFTACLEVDRNYTPAVVGLVEAFLNAAKSLYDEGRLFRAAHHVTLALVVLAGTNPIPDLQCIWKLLGDLCAFTHYLPEEACDAIQSNHIDQLTKGLGQYQQEIPPPMATSTRSRLFALGAACYAKVLCLGNSASVEGDLAIILYLQSLLCDHEDKDMASKNLSLAVEAAKRAVVQDSSAPRLWGVLGVVAAKAANPRLAQHAFIKSLNLQNNAGTWTNLGVFYMLHGQIQLAHKAFAQSQAQDPSMPRAWVGLAIIAEQIGDSVYLDLYQHVAELDFTMEGYMGFATTTYQSYAKARHSVAANQILKAAYVAGKCASREPTNFTAHNLYGLLLEASSLPHAAVTSFRSALTALTSSTNEKAVEHRRKVSTNLARTLLATGHYEEAEEIYTKYTDLSGDVHCAAGLAHAQFSSGKLQAAKEAYKAALVLAERNKDTLIIADVLIALALTAYGNRDVLQAKDLLFQCLQRIADYPRCLFTLCALGLVTNDPVLSASAMVEYDRMPSSKKTNALVLSQAALLEACLCLLRGEPKKGVFTLSKAVHSIGHSRAEVWGTLSAFLLVRMPSKAHLAAISLAASHVITTATIGSAEENSELLALHAVSLLATGSTNRITAQTTAHTAWRQAQKAIHTNPSNLGAWCSLAAAGLTSSSLESSMVAQKKLSNSVRVVDYVRLQTVTEQESLRECIATRHPVWVQNQSKRLNELQEWATMCLAEGMILLAATLTPEMAGPYLAQAQNLCQQTIGSLQPGPAQATWYRLLGQCLSCGPNGHTHTSNVIASYKAALQVNPHDLKAWNVSLLYLGMIGLWTDNDELVSQAIGQALKIDQSCGTALLLQALRLQIGGDARQIRRHFTSAQQNTAIGSAQNTMAGLELAATLITKGDLEAASTILAQSLPPHPSFIDQ